MSEPLPDCVVRRGDSINDDDMVERLAGGHVFLRGKILGKNVIRLVAHAPDDKSTNLGVLEAELKPAKTHLLPAIRVFTVLTAPGLRTPTDLKVAAEMVKILGQGLKSQSGFGYMFADSAIDNIDAGQLFDTCDWMTLQTAEGSKNIRRVWFVPKEESQVSGKKNRG